MATKATEAVGKHCRARVVALAILWPTRSTPSAPVMSLHRWLLPRSRSRSGCCLLMETPSHQLDLVCCRSPMGWCHRHDPAQQTETGSVVAAETSRSSHLPFLSFRSRRLAKVLLRFLYPLLPRAGSRPVTATVLVPCCGVRCRCITPVPFSSLDTLCQKNMLNCTQGHTNAGKKMMASFAFDPRVSNPAQPLSSFHTAFFFFLSTGSQILSEPSTNPSLNQIDAVQTSKKARVTNTTAIQCVVCVRPRVNCPSSQ